jgi:hypothetical protein
MKHSTAGLEPEALIADLERARALQVIQAL